MSLLDLFEMARQNATRLADLCATHTGAIVDFAGCIAREGKLSVTMKTARLQAFLDGGRYLNPWEECHRDAHGDEAVATALMQERQKTWYGRRAKFDGSFVDGKKFRYGALYVQGRALVDGRYGPFCAIFRLDAASSWKSIAWLPENSLERYVPDEHTLDDHKLCIEVGAHEARHHIAAIKHKDDVSTWPRNEWFTRCCNNDVFIEGIVADELLVEHVERVLVDRDTWRDLLKSNAEVLAGTGTAEHQAKASHYKMLKDLLSNRKLLGTMEQV